MISGKILSHPTESVGIIMYDQWFITPFHVRTKPLINVIQNMEVRKITMTTAPISTPSIKASSKSMANSSVIPYVTPITTPYNLFGYMLTNHPVWAILPFLMRTKNIINLQLPLEGIQML